MTSNINTYGYIKQFGWRLFCAALLLVMICSCSDTSVRKTGLSVLDRPTNPRVNDVAAPVGVGNEIYFGWYVNNPDENEIQTAYQILVATSAGLLNKDKGDVWDSGKVKSRLQNHVVYSGGSLVSDTKYLWKVRTWDKDKQAGEWSEYQGFVTGLLENSDWQGANWIKRDTDDADDYTYYRKTVDMQKKTIERATVYITSVHKYELYVNGELVGKGPAYHHPQYQYYNGFDITPVVKSGTNQFAIFNHWFGGGQGRPKSARGVIAKAIVHYTDGSSEVIATDGTWLQAKAEAWMGDQPHRNRGEGVGYVEKIDASKLIPDWYKPKYDDSGWQAATVIGPQPVKPWTGTLRPDLSRIEEHVIEPASITKRADGAYMVDLGKVYSGMPRVNFAGGTAGETVNMQGGYILDADGKIIAKGNQKTNLAYFAVLNGEAFTYAPTEYMGMRYFEIANSPMPVTKDNFSFVVRYSEVDEESSSFESADSTLNNVWELMKHSIYVCAQEEFVDTPTREKGGFLGDGTIQSTAAMDVTNERVLTRRALNEFLDSMEQFWSEPELRGRMNAVYPNNDGRRDIPDFTQAYLLWAWNYYMNTGDIKFLSDNYDKLKDIADYVHKYTDESTGLIKNLEGGGGAYKYGIVDWPASMRFDYDITDIRTVINGWAVADFSVISRIALELGNDTDSEIYRERAGKIVEAMNAHLINDEGVYVDGLNAEGTQSRHVSQQANMIPFALGVTPGENSQKVFDKIKELKMRSGMVTLPWLIHAIGRAEEGEYLFELYTNKEWLGWARCLSLGATSTWETWYANEDGQSMSHSWGISGLEGYVRYILGIRPISPQYEKVLIKPLDFGDKLEWAKGAITTDRGLIKVDWNRSPEQYTMKVEIPVNVDAIVALPKGVAENPTVYLDEKQIKAEDDGDFLTIKNVGSGEHEIVVNSK